MAGFRGAMKKGVWWRPDPRSGTPVPPKAMPLTAADIHAVYARKSIQPAGDGAKQFQSTNHFARDPSHSGLAPKNPRDRKVKPSF